MNFPSQIFFNNINHGYRAATLKEKFFVAASILYGCGYLFVIYIMKRCADRCALHLDQTSRTQIYEHVFHKLVTHNFSC